MSLLSKFLNRTPLHFKTYKKGELIVREGDVCQSVICIVSGHAVIQRVTLGGKLAITERAGCGMMMGMENLFGKDICYNFEATADEECGIMEFSKESFTIILQSEMICLLNYLNFLAYRAQRGPDALRTIQGNRFIDKVGYLVTMATDPQSESVTLSSRQTTIPEIFGSQVDNIIREQLSAIGISLDECNKRLLIPSREKFINYLNERGSD